jgi:hypothetical protein
MDVQASATWHEQDMGSQNLAKGDYDDEIRPPIEKRGGRFNGA